MSSLPRPCSVSSGSDALASGSNTPIVQTDCDMKTSIEELFGVLNQPSTERSKPWGSRNLPYSFYNEPLDSRHGTRSPCGSGVRHQSPKRTATGLPVIHGRSVSSPANLVQSLSIKTTPQHSRQNSFDGFIDSNQPSYDVICGQQPAWSEAIVKQPRYSADSAISADSPSSLVVPNRGLPLPLGVSMQPNNPVPMRSFQQTDLSVDSLPLPAGWEKGLSPEGEVYYIDHNTKTTSWTHPALAKHRNPTIKQLSSVVPRQLPLGSSTSVQVDSTGRPLTTEQLIQIQLQLQEVQEKKFMLQREQQAIEKKERMLAEMMKSSAVISSPTPATGNPMGMHGGGQAAAAAATTTGVAAGVGGGLPMARPVTNNVSTGLDTFQMQSIQNPLTTHSVHVRQSSVDSGLGGMGTTYSLSRTPDDFLGNVDENMDTRSGAAGLFGVHMDFGSLLDAPLDSEQLTSNFGDISGDLVVDPDMDIQTGGQTWL